MKQGQSLTPTEQSATASQKPETSTRQFSNRELRVIFEGGADADPLPEIERIFRAIMPESGSSFIQKIHLDLNAIFSGKFQGFRESDVKYHDLRHTRNVTLATIRLFHGLHCESVFLPPDVIKLCILCSYFHDTGMLLTVKDAEHSGAAYLKHHEERSISFARQYMHNHGFPIAYMDNCESIINCTNLTKEPEDIIFESEEIQLAGHVLGTADILAQMADRYYLECLPLLYNEQQDAGIQQHPSSISLMRQTTRFYHDVIERRLHQGFNNRLMAMQTHFREWWGLDSNLYLEYINKNISYLEDVVQKYDNGEGDLALYLRRRQPKV
jgi:hypothetical protein